MPCFARQPTDSRPTSQQSSQREKKKKGRVFCTHSRVAAPDVNIRIRDRLARVVIHNLDGQGQGDAGLAIRNFLPDLLTLDVCVAPTN